MENPLHNFREMSPVLQLIARERKKSVFSVTFIFIQRNFFNIYVLSQSIAYWINFRIYLLLHIKKDYSMHFCCLYLYLGASLGVSLRIQSECGKMRTRKNSVFGHFTQWLYFIKKCIWWKFQAHTMQGKMSLHRGLAYS